MRHLAFSCILIAFLTGLAAAGTKPEEVVTKNLDSIGTADARAAVKSRAVQGTLQFKILLGGSGETAGLWQLFSEPNKSNVVLKFGGGDWWGERFVFDGEKTSFAIANSSHQYSVVGEFMRSHDFIVKDGLLGGELSMNWALTNLDHLQAKLESMGLKKIDGRELEGVEYLSKRNGEMAVRLYFDPATGRHVMTVYSVERAANIAHNDIANAKQQQIHYTVEERFSDFQTSNGITLPRHYDLHYTQQMQNGSMKEYEWIMTVDKVLDNAAINPVNFQAK
ncbi:MAG: hypothetical protein ABSC33_06660 [Candidatus Sulfotelmatobacter sp.]|jgi:hypothetical protein